MSSTRPTSPQCHQEATCYAECSSYLIASPEQCRTPTNPSAAFTSAVPPPPIAQTLSEGPVTYGQQTFHHLPPHIAAMVHNLPPISTNPSTISTSAAPPPPIVQAPSREPTIYGQQTFYHLPPDIAAQVQSLLPLHPLRGRPSSSTLGPPPVSLTFILII